VTPAWPRPAPGNSGHIEFLQVLCEEEISRRESMSMHRRLRQACFEEQATMEGFDFTASPKLPAAQIRDLAALAGWTPASPSSSTVRSAAGRPHRKGAENPVSYATWAYSRIRPPSRSRRTTQIFVPIAGGCERPAGGLCYSVRCGR
jgi:hypothetical protein